MGADMLKTRETFAAALPHVFDLQTVTVQDGYPARVLYRPGPVADQLIAAWELFEDDQLPRPATK
jgi:hypothetical protein